MAEVCLGRVVEHNSPARLSKRKPPKAKLEAAFREVYSDEPSTVTRANVSGERKRKMLAAIAFSKARKGK